MGYSKRIFDILFSSILLVLLFPVLFASWLIASIETASNGFFLQKRVGQHGKLFYIIKIKTMRDSVLMSDSACLDSKRITRFGNLFRKYKIDELPQLINIILGQMSFVGPRPDLPGYADALVGADRRILDYRPGITSPASLYYRDEEYLMSLQADPEYYNKHVIWPAKTKLNLWYVDNWSFRLDLSLMLKTIFASCLS